MKLSLIILGICIAIVPGQAYSYDTCYFSSFSNWWTLTVNPWWAVFAEGVTSPNACYNLVAWVNYMSTNYAPGSASLNPFCFFGCWNGQICVARPALSSFNCGANPSGATYTRVWPAILAQFTATAPPSTAPVPGCYCPYINNPTTITSNFFANLQSWINALNPTNPTGFFLASFNNGSIFPQCAAISTCPSNQFYLK